MKTIFVIYTNKKIEKPGYQKRYAFNTASDIKVGDMIDSPSYDTNMQVVQVLDKGYKFFNSKTGDMSNEMTNSNLYEIRELEIRANEDKKIYGSIITSDEA